MRKIILGSIFALVFSGFAYAEDIKIRNAWVSESAPGEETASIQLEIISKKDAKLVEVASGMAQNGEIHSMVMEGDTMTMQKLTEFDLPAKTSVSFGSGGNYLMLIGLRKPLQVGRKLPFALTFKFENGKTTLLRVLAIIKSRSKEKHEDAKLTNS